jgi:hypothetical protein
MSKEGCGVCLKSPHNILVVLVVLVPGKRFCRQSCSAFGQLVAMSLVSLVGQCFVPRGGPASLVGLIHQHFLMRGRCHFCQRRSKLCDCLLSHHCGGCRHLMATPLLGERHICQRCSVSGLLLQRRSSTSSANALSAVALARSANSRRRCSAANAFSAVAVAHSANSWRRCSAANAFSAIATARSADSLQRRSLASVSSTNVASRAAASWRRCSLASASCRCCLFASWRHCSLANASCRRRLSASSAKAFSCAAAACRRCSSVSAAREQQSCSYRRRARAALRCCCRKV